MPDSWWAKNLEGTVPQHAFTRLIDQMGNVFSFGTRSPYSKEQSGTSGLTSFLTTWSTHLRAPDYLELLECPLRRVTTIPLTQERFDLIIEFANSLNSGSGIRFNFLRQNCVRIVQAFLYLAGIDINTKTTLPSVAYAMLPSGADCPLIGHTLSKVTTCSLTLLRPMSSCIGDLYSAAPEQVKTTIHHVANAALYLPRTVSALALSTLTVCLGSGRMKPRDESEQKHQEDTIDNDLRVTSFRRLVTFRNCTDPKTFTLFHNFKLIEWQNLQCSTVYHKHGGGFCIDPEQGKLVHPES